MKRLQVPGIVHLYRVDAPAEIRGLAADRLIDRDFDLRTCPLNWFLLKRSLAVLSVAGRRFPTMIGRNSAQRRIHQQELADSLDARAAAIRLGPDELEPLARWIRGAGAESAVGMLAQQLLGRLFLPTFVATPASWAAALMLVQAPRSPNVIKVLWWFATGKIRRAQGLLGGMVNGDLSAVNAIGIAVHNLIKGLHHMRRLYADAAARTALTPAAAMQQCLFAPVSLIRQATAAGRLGSCAFPRNSLFVLEIGKASRREDGRPLVFMDGTWSQCPASDWVPAMLEGLWLRASQEQRQAPTSHYSAV